MFLLISYFESLACLHTLYIIVEKPKLDSIKVSRNIKIIYIKSSLQVFCVVVNCIQHKSLYDSVCVKRHITRFAHGHTNRHNFLCNSIPPNFSSKIHPHMLIFHNLSLHLYSHIPLWYLFSLLLLSLSLSLYSLFLFKICIACTYVCNISKLHFTQLFSDKVVILGKWMPSSPPPFSEKFTYLVFPYKFSEEKNFLHDLCKNKDKL